MTTGTQSTHTGKRVHPRSPSAKQVQDAQDALSKGGRAFPTAMDGTVPKNGKAKPSEAVASITSDKSVSVPRPDADIEAKLQKLARRMDEIEDKRAELNDKAAKIRDEVKDMGVKVETFMYSRKIAKLEKEAQEIVDLSHALVRKALGCPVQTDWVDEKAN